MKTEETEVDVRVDAILRAGNPGSPTSGQWVQAAISDAKGEARDDVRRARRWKVAPIAVAAALVAGVSLGGGLPAIADTVQQLAAQSGIFGDGNGPNGAASGKKYSEMDDSEWINLNAKDFPQYAVTLVPAYVTLPASVDRQRFAKNIVEGLAGGASDGRGARMQITGIKRFFEANAQCLWYADWRDSAKSGNAAEASLAAAQYEKSTTWKELVATDGGGVIANMKAIYADGSQGDWTAAATAMGTDCSTADIASVIK